MGDICISKAGFLDIYDKTRPQALTEKNIWSGFCKAGLVPFNPAAALSQLPLAPPTLPRPTAPIPQDTPRNLQQFKSALSSLETFFQEEAAWLEQVEMLRNKLAKAVATWTAEINILRKDNADFFYYS
jgi:hypothetical protein